MLSQDTRANQPSESIIRKIQNLFELAGHNPNENEAAAAMSKAQELLAKYNLEYAEVKSQRVAGGAAQLEPEKREETQAAYTAMYQWQQNLMHEIAEANFCWHWVNRVQDKWQITGNMRKEHDHVRWVKRHCLLGKQSNVLVAQMMYQYLADTIERLVPYKGAERLSRSANSWREGCADRLIERIQEKAEHMKTEGTGEGSGCTALAIQDLHVQEYAANYDARYGVGAYAKMKMREAENEKRWAQREADQAAAAKVREEERARTLAGETPAQRDVRERKEAREAAKQAARDARWWDRERRRSQREAARRDVSAYCRGHKAAGDINLDSQLNQPKEKGKLN